MTDYLEELLDQLEEEEAGTAARWPEGQAPAWAESPGCAALWEEELTGHSPVSDRAEAVRREALGVLDPSGEMETTFLPGPSEIWAAAWGPVPPEMAAPDAYVPGFQETAAWTVPQLDALEEAAGKELKRPALLEQAERLERTVGQARGGAAAVRSARVETGELTTPGRAGRRPWGWSERGEDPAAAVDRAFQRDSRRYDQGFALY